MTKTLKNYYFTFGTDEQYPICANDYLLIKADNIYDASLIFQYNYPNRPGSNCLNYAFDYTEEEWKKNNMCQRFYNNKLPIKTIIADEHILDQIKNKTQEDRGLEELNLD